MQGDQGKYSYIKLCVFPLVGSKSSFIHTTAWRRTHTHMLQKCRGSAPTRSK